MSPALKSIVTAFGPVLKTVICPLPLIQYCHSSALGCQCISRKPPGRTVTSAAATVVETVKLRLSAMCTVPPFVSRAGAPDPSEKVKGCGGAPFPLTAWRSAARSPGSLPWNIEITQRDVLERLDRDTEVLGENIRRRMREPFRHQESGELGGLAFIETDKKLAAVGAEALQRMRQTGGEIPKVPFFHVGDIRSAHFVERRDATGAVGHVGPFRELVPVHLADAAGR